MKPRTLLNIMLLIAALGLGSMVWGSCHRLPQIGATYIHNDDKDNPFDARRAKVIAISNGWVLVDQGYPSSMSLVDFNLFYSKESK